MSVQRKNERHEKKRVLVGMSGGVDSSVSAALLVEAGYDVTGAFMKNFSDTTDLWTGECEWKRDRRDAMRVAASLGIPLLTFDFESAYRERVLERMFKEYEMGITPNPDVLCNEEIKFGLFFQEAMKLGYDAVATGHYARVEKNEPDTFHLLKGLDPNKDQSYFLHRMPTEALSRVMFPVGGLMKEEVRRMAEERGLATADKPDSQGICFVGNLDMKEFLRKKIEPTPGDVVTIEGDIVGSHDGLDAITIGQRHGFDVKDNRHAWYAAKKDRVQNRLIVVPERDHELLYSKSAVVRDMRWLGGMLREGDTAEVAVRYRAELASCTITKMTETSLEIEFSEPVWGIAAGQSAVFYRGDICLGGGFLADSSL